MSAFNASGAVEPPTAHPSDRRAVVVRLSQPGQSPIANCGADREHGTAQVLGGISAGDLAVFSAVPDRCSPAGAPPTSWTATDDHKQVQLRMGHANVRAWVDDIMPLLASDEDPLGVDTLATHRLPLDAAPLAYADLQEKNGTVKVLL